MHIAGYIASLFIGVALGLIGGGGSILTVPVLVYLFGLAPITATSYSLFIVGVTSLIGAINSWRRGALHVHTAISFGLASTVTVFITRRYIVPNIPEMISIGNVSVRAATLTLILFGLLMLAASFSMITRTMVKDHRPVARPNKGILALCGVGIGLVTGFLGAGGGFLLIPALVLLLHQPMDKAVGTSLLIIAVNSLIGFAADAGNHSIRPGLLVGVTAIAIVGVFAGGRLQHFIHTGRLRQAFGWFVLAMGVFIITREIFS